MMVPRKCCPHVVCRQQGLADAVGVSNFSAKRTREAAKRLEGEGVPLASNQVGGLEWQWLGTRARGPQGESQQASNRVGGFRGVGLRFARRVPAAVTPGGLTQSRPKPDRWCCTLHSMLV